MNRREAITGVGAALAAGSASARAPTAARVPRIDTLSAGVAAEPDFAALIDAGMDAAVFDIDIWPREPEPAHEGLAAWATAEGAEGSRVRVVRVASDLDRAIGEGRFGVILACQDATILGSNAISYADTNLEILRSHHEGGLRVLQLTHNMRNGLGDGFQEDTPAGLSILGHVVVAEMGRLRMLIDVSHCGPATTDEAIALSERPVAVTHSGCRAVFDTACNKTDAVIRALADKGGYFGVFSMSRWLTAAPTSSVENVVDHIDHAVRIGGLQAVGFGSDQPLMGDPTPQANKVAALTAYQTRNLGRAGAEPLKGHVTCPDLDTPSRMAVLDSALSRRGYAAAARDAILGGNFRRVFETVCG